MKRILMLIVLVAAVVLAAKANAAVHGIGYHRLDSPVHCPSYDHVTTWWWGTKEYGSCSASLTVTIGG